MSYLKKKTNRMRSSLGGHFAGTGIEEDSFDDVGGIPFKGRLKDTAGTRRMPYAGHMDLARVKPWITLPHEKKEDWEKLNGKVKSYKLGEEPMRD